MGQLSSDSGKAPLPSGLCCALGLRLRLCAAASGTVDFPLCLELPVLAILADAPLSRSSEKGNILGTELKSKLVAAAVLDNDG